MSPRLRTMLAVATASAVHRLHREDAIALPIAMAMLTLTLVLGLVAVNLAVSSNDGASRDSEVKRALQAADAGVQTALVRMNNFGEQTTHLTDGSTCLVRLADGTFDYLAPVDVGGTQWCPSGPAEELGNGESYQYTVSSFADVDFDELASTLDRKIVSTGTAAGVTRRVVEEVSALDARRLFSDYAAFSSEDLVLSNNTDVGSPEVSGNARSNGSIYLNNPNARIWGDATPGPGGTVSAPTQVTGSSSPAAETISLPAPRMEDARPNDNGNICGLLDLGCTISSLGADYTWDPTARSLSLKKGTLTLTGNVFAFCSLDLSGGILELVPANPAAPIQIYLGSLPAEDPDYPEPDNCASAPTLTMSNNPEIRNASTLHPIVQIYVDGPGTVSFSNNNATPEVPLALYAPGSTVSLSNHAHIRGGIAARKLTLENNTAIVPATASGSLTSLTASIYERRGYRECVSSPPAAGTSPDSGC